MDEGIFRIGPGSETLKVGRQGSRSLREDSMLNKKSFWKDMLVEHIKCILKDLTHILGKETRN